MEAIKVAEEREKYVKSVFNKYDTDGSNSIDMDELSCLLEDLGLLNQLKTPPKEFIKEMFLKYDTNYDGVLE